MAEIRIAGIMRAGAFSPNHIGNDAAIFNMVAEQLRKRGCVVNTYSEEQFATSDITENVIVNMCRERRSIERLQQLEDAGTLVVNSGYGIENCIRERMARIFIGSNIPFPRSVVVNTNENVRDELRRLNIERCWVKRGDEYTIHKEDVSYVRNADGAQDVLQEYFLRGIKRAVISEHIEGELVKFYGIAGTSFFHCFHPFDPGSPDEGPSSKASSYKGDKGALNALCERAAQLLDVVLYGGDGIIGPDGDVTIIAFNDWPSYGPCRAEAAPQIARRILSLVKQHNK